MDKKQVWVIGHKNPDTDSVCAAIAYANLKNSLEDRKEYGTSATEFVAMPRRNMY